MNRKRASKRILQSLCGEVHADDGIDPAEFFRSQPKPRSKNHHKTLQLCQQTAERLSLTLGSELGERLGNLRIVSVSPAPDASQLLVIVAPALAGEAIEPADVQAALAAAAGKLRAEVAAAITRRRAPKLLFQFIADSTPEAHR